MLGLGVAALAAHAILMRRRAFRRRIVADRPNGSMIGGPSLSPTVIVIYALSLAALLEALQPLTAAPARTWPWVLAGAAVALGAEWWMQAASKTLKRHATTEDANEPAAVLLDEGPFARSRNPIYCGMILLFAGIAMAAASLWAALCLPVLFAALHRMVVLPEERGLTERFGPVYRRYLERVPRYL
ncbi:hypothetical protein ASG43_08215 [Aureimonas sp. Leaf454]|nr:hypothetical protein ASG43_08215 [Aureimonas sp. Leaf454]